MLLSTLLQTVKPVSEKMSFQRLILDSNLVQKGDVFIALKGHQPNADLYLNDAISKGAVAVLLESNDDTTFYRNNVPIIPIPHLGQLLGTLASQYYHHPSKQLRVIGVTGTNGKTTCTHFMAQILQSMNVKCGISGTLGTGLYGDLKESRFTTPDAITLQRSLKHFLENGANVIAMEVSSHGIDQGRINETHFELGVFTNLSQDHLDYHGSMEQYAKVKYSFLQSDLIRSVVLNIDDNYGDKWTNSLAAEKPTYLYSLQQKNKLGLPLTTVKNIQLNEHGTIAYLMSPWGEGEIELPILGTFNLSNTLAVITSLCVLGLPFEDVKSKIKELTPVQGRMQFIQQDKKPLVVVDYAHSPDALSKLLSTLRSHTKGKLLCVFGCGGDRDKTKRPLMAQVVEKWADQAIITNDNPRHEKPESIVEDILKGFSKSEMATVMLDRSKAIEKSLKYASPSDCIVIAGKGAERFQIVGDDRIPFSDIEIAQNLLSKI